MTKNPTEGNNSSDNSSGRDDRRGGRPRTNSGGYNNRSGSSNGNRSSSSGRDGQGGGNRDNRSNSGGGYNNDRPRSGGQGGSGGYNNRDNRSGSGSSYGRGRSSEGGSDRSRPSNDFKPRQDYKPRENRDGGNSGSSYPPRENRNNSDNRSSSGRSGTDRNSSYPKRESVRPSEGGSDSSYKPREGGYNRDNNRGGDRPREGGYNRDNNRGGSGGYNRDNNRSSSGNAGFNNRNRGGSGNDRPRREGEAGDRRNPIANKIRSAYYNAHKNDEAAGGARGDNSFRQRSDQRPKRQEHAPNYQLPAEENRDSKVSRLNKYIANSGICSRREADKLIEQGLISINGKVVAELGFKVNQGDEVRYEGRIIRPEKNVYVLLNKPKDFITTTEDPDERRTVMNLVANACHERIYPVGRLDRNTTGLLLFTNDGDLAKRLTHPSHNISKIYQVELDKPLAKEDFDTIAAGFQLEDGKFKSDDLAYIDPSNPSVIGIEIHEGRNRLVRRVFEHFGYKVFRLDRVLYAGLTKKDLPRGNWRYLTEKEVLQLKYKN